MAALKPGHWPIQIGPLMVKTGEYQKERLSTGAALATTTALARSPGSAGTAPIRRSRIRGSRRLMALAALRNLCGQHPRQIDFMTVSSFAFSLAFSRSMSALPMPSPLVDDPATDDESAVPREFVPGAAALVPEAPPEGAL